MKHTEELWHKLSIEVSDERHVDVYLGKRFVASFSSHFTTKGRGGLMLLSGNHQSTFRRFDIKGNGCTYSIFHTNGYIFMLSYKDTGRFNIISNILQTQEHYYPQR